MEDLEDVTPKAIRILIAEHDLKLQQVAEVAGVGYKGLSDIIHGRRVMGPGMRARLARAMERIEANPPTRRPQGRAAIRESGE